MSDRVGNRRSQAFGIVFALRKIEAQEQRAIAELLNRRAAFDRPRRSPMRKLAIELFAGAGALFTGSANAADIYMSNEYASADLLQQVRLICDEGGRRYRTERGRRGIRRFLQLCAA
jgi:hypothetical protein